ncbi:MAG: phosphotransferase family protein [Jatrophihabitans sp.]
MQLQSVERAPGAFQQGVAADDIEAMCRRAFGNNVQVVRAVEIGVGTYNSTYRVDIEGRAAVILRVAPRRASSDDVSQDGMRNEHAAAPNFASLDPLIPRTLAVDFTHQIVERDYLIQTALVGVSAADGLAAYPRESWHSYYRQLGSITRAIHAVRGPSFGPVAGPQHDRWSAELRVQFGELAAEVAAADLDQDGVQRVLACVDVHRGLLDEVTEPRLLHGDLWSLNILIDPNAAEPTITGVLDCDRASWGDPLADWTIHKIRQRPSSEADPFWESYDRPADTDAAVLRKQFYQARHLIGSRLDIHRRGMDISDIPPVHWDLADVLARLGG